MSNSDKRRGHLSPTLNPRASKPVNGTTHGETPGSGPARGGGSTQPSTQGEPTGKTELARDKDKMDGCWAENATMANSVATLMGTPAQVYCNDGNTYEGLFATLNGDGDAAIHCVNKVVGGETPRAEDLQSIVIFKADDFKMIKFEGVDLKFAEKSEVGFTDGEISGCRLDGGMEQNGGGRELQPWVGDEEEAHGEGIDAGLGGNTASGWSADEMFKINEEKFDIHSDYQDNMLEYTTPLKVEDTEEYRRKREYAGRMAKDIMSKGSYARHRDLENSDERTEEELHAGVPRPQKGGQSSGAQHGGGGGQWETQHSKKSGGSRARNQEGSDASGNAPVPRGGDRGSHSRAPSGRGRGPAGLRGEGGGKGAAPSDATNWRQPPAATDGAGSKNRPTTDNLVQWRSNFNMAENNAAAPADQPGPSQPPAQPQQQGAGGVSGRGPAPQQPQASPQAPQGHGVVGLAPAHGGGQAPPQQQQRHGPVQQGPPQAQLGPHQQHGAGPAPHVAAHGGPPVQQQATPGGPPSAQHTSPTGPGVGMPTRGGGMAHRGPAAIPSQGPAQQGGRGPMPPPQVVAVPSAQPPPRQLAPREGPVPPPGAVAHPSQGGPNAGPSLSQAARSRSGQDALEAAKAMTTDRKERSASPAVSQQAPRQGATPTVGLGGEKESDNVSVCSEASSTKSGKPISKLNPNALVFVPKSFQPKDGGQQKTAHVNMEVEATKPSFGQQPLGAHHQQPQGPPLQQAPVAAPQAAAHHPQQHVPAQMMAYPPFAPAAVPAQAQQPPQMGGPQPLHQHQHVPARAPHPGAIRTDGPPVMMGQQPMLVPAMHHPVPQTTPPLGGAAQAGGALPPPQVQGVPGSQTPQPPVVATLPPPTTQAYAMYAGGPSPPPNAQMVQAYGQHHPHQSGAAMQHAAAAHPGVPAGPHHGGPPHAVFYPHGGPPMGAGGPMGGAGAGVSGPGGPPQALAHGQPGGAGGQPMLFQVLPNGQQAAAQQFHGQGGVMMAPGMVYQQNASNVPGAGHPHPPHMGYQGGHHQ